MPVVAFYYHNLVANVPVGETVLSYQSYSFAMPALKSIPLKIEISDYGNYLYWQSNSNKNLQLTKSKLEPILELDRLLVKHFNCSHELNSYLKNISF